MIMTLIIRAFIFYGLYLLIKTIINIVKNTYFISSSNMSSGQREGQLKKGRDNDIVDVEYEILDGEKKPGKKE